MAIDGITWEQTINDLLTGMNILGLGADPLAIALSAMVAIALTQGEIFIKQKYTNSVVTFLACYIGWFTVGLATNSGILITLVIIGSIGIILDESTEVYRS